jgi:hypothetical protein
MTGIQPGAAVAPLQLVDNADDAADSLAARTERGPRER